MTTYTAIFRTAAERAEHDIKARSPEQALQRARRLWDTDCHSLAFESYCALQRLDSITIEGGDAPDLEWIAPEAALELAAGDLLAAAQAALDYLTELAIDLDDEPEQMLAGIRIDLAEAIAKAKGGAP